MNNTKANTDLRVQKTLSALAHALEELLKEKDLDEITVKELCEKAQTRKATFYNHFTDKYDLFSYMILTVMRTSEEEEIVQADTGDPSDYYTGIFSYLMDFSENNEIMASRMLKGSGSSVISELYCAQMEPIIAAHLKRYQKNNAAILSPELLSRMITGAILEGGRYWFFNRDKLDKKTALAQFNSLICPLFAQTVYLPES